MKFTLGNLGQSLPFTSLYFLGDNGLQILTPAAAHHLLMEVIAWGGNNAGAGGTYAKRLVNTVPGTKVTLTLTSTPGSGFVQAQYGVSGPVAKAFNANGNTRGNGTGDLVNLGGVATASGGSLGGGHTATAGGGAGGPTSAGANGVDNVPGTSGGDPAGAGGPSGQNGQNYGGGGGLNAQGAPGLVRLTWS